MDEKDKELQELRRKNAKLTSWVEELELKNDELTKFTTWLKDVAFGEEQYNRIISEYEADKAKTIMS